MIHLLRSYRTLVLGALALGILAGAFLGIARFTRPAFAAPDTPAAGLISTVPSAAKACDAARYQSLLDIAVTARTEWSITLSPQAFAAYADARQTFTRYAARCAKKLGLDANAGMQRVLGKEPHKAETTTGPAAPLVNIADLRITKFVEPFTPIQAGQTFTYTIFVDNYGPDIANNVVITDTLLNNAAVTIQSCAFSVSQGGGAITQFTCTTGPVVSTQFGTDIGTFATNMLQPLAPGQQGRLRGSFRLVANEPVDIQNTSRVVSSDYDPDLSNNFATVANSVFAAADLQLSKIDTPDPVNAGDEISYTLTITNTGPSTAHNVFIKDFLPAQVDVLSVTASTGACAAGTPGNAAAPTQCNLGALASGASATTIITTRVRPEAVTQQMLLHNDAFAYADEFDPDNGDNITTQDTTVNPLSADLALVKSGPATAGAGELINYTLALSNNGNGSADAVQVSDYIPGALKLISVTPTQGTCVAGEAGNPLLPLVCQLGAVNAGASADVAIVAQIKPSVEGDTIIFNDAQAAAASRDANPADNLSSVQTTTTATCTVLPAVPTLISPADSATIATRKMLLDWSDANCALHYRVRVRQDAPNGLLVAKAKTKRTQVEIGPLTKTHTYYWQVKACNGLGCVLTPVQSFTLP